MSNGSSKRRAEFTIPAALDFDQILKEAQADFYKDPNVIGVGFGPRRVKVTE